MRYDTFAVLVLCVFLLVACERSETEQPPLVRGVPQLPAGTPPVAFEPLNSHMPRIINHSDNGELSRMTLWAMGADGLRERVFDITGNQWSDWVIRGIPSDALYPPVNWDELGRRLLVNDGYAHDRAQVAVAYSYHTSGVNTDVKLALPTDAVPFGTSSGFVENTYGTRNWFQPGVAVSDENSGRFHIFGNWHGGGPNSPEDRLVSVSFEVGAAGAVRPLRTEPRELPPLMIGGSEVPVSIGPNSAVHVPKPFDGGSRPSHTFVFVKWKQPGQDGVALWYDDGAGNASWFNLGVPLASGSQIIGNPVAFTWYNGTLNRTSVNLFVVARSSEGNGRAELYERYWSVDGNTPVASPEHWAAWNSHGSPRWDPDDDSKGHLLEAETSWRLTTALTWQYNGVDRVNVFGYANPETDRDGVAQPRRLVEYYWDGSVWKWGTPHEPPPSGLGVRTQSASWVHKDGTTRISVACRDEAGGIQERYFLIDSNGWNGWQWNDLTN